jgi:hypothetical protein
MPLIEDLGLRHAVALAALLRVGMTEVLRGIEPVGWTEDRFGPTPELEKDLLNRLVVAGGQIKRDALLGTLRGGYATTLVTDDSTAAHLLERIFDQAKVPGQTL